jgi:hypothetical protein
MISWAGVRLLLALMLVLSVHCASKDKSQGHKGVLAPYTGKQLPCKVTKAQEKQLDDGKSVLHNQRQGKTGMGVCIADINSPPGVCMEKITDLKAYPGMVPHVKKVNIYEKSKGFDGSTKTGAEFQVGLLGMKFGYYLQLKRNPVHNTLTWTLDYRYNSDFDDNVGHWQVMKHPTKAGWTRLLYSCKVKLFPWIPEFIVRFLTSNALKESTTWVKKEAEREAKKRGVGSFAKNGGAFQAPGWMNKFSGGFIAHDIRELQQGDMNKIRSGFKHRPFQLRIFK